MKSYRITYTVVCTNTYSSIVEARDEEDAKEKFDDGYWDIESEFVDTVCDPLMDTEILEIEEVTDDDN